MNWVKDCVQVRKVVIEKLDFSQIKKLCCMYETYLYTGIQKSLKNQKIDLSS